MTNTNMTFAELKDAIKTEMQLDPGLISDVERARFINDCIDDLGLIPFFEKDITILSTLESVALPNDFIEVIQLKRASDSFVLKPLSLDVMNTTTGTPIGYIHRYSTLELFPKPLVNTNVKLYYAYKPAHLVNDTDRPDIPNGFSQLLVDFGVAKANRKNGNIAVFREYMSYYEAKKNFLIQELLRRYNTRVTNMVDSSEITPLPSDEILL